MSEKEAIFKLTRSMIDACESCKDLRTRETHLQGTASLESVLKPSHCVKNDDVIEWEHEET